MESNNWKMTKFEKVRLREMICENLLCAMSDEYAPKIAEAITDAVAEDIEACADREWNDSDMDLAIGRVLMDKFGIEH